MTILSGDQVADIAIKTWSVTNSGTDSASIHAIKDLTVTAIAISFAEDGSHDTDAVHTNSDGSKDLGLWQINDRAHPDLISSGQWNDPNANAHMALSIWQAAGGKWTPWSTYNNGAYKLQLAAANAAYDNAIKGIIAGGPVPGQLAPAPIDSLTGFLNGIGDFFSKLGDPKFWASVGIIIAGGIMLLIVAFHLLKSSKTVQNTAKIAAKAAVLA